MSQHKRKTPMDEVVTNEAYAGLLERLGFNEHAAQIRGMEPPLQRRWKGSQGKDSYFTRALRVDPAVGTLLSAVAYAADEGDANGITGLPKSELEIMLHDIEVNHAFAAILRGLGYPETAKTIEISTISIYLDWLRVKDSRGELFFRDLDVDWHERRYLNRLFRGGQYAILEAAEMDHRRLRADVEKYRIGPLDPQLIATHRLVSNPQGMRKAIGES